MTDDIDKSKLSERFISDGSGLTFDNSKAEGEPFDFSPWSEDDERKERENG